MSRDDEYRIWQAIVDKKRNWQTSLDKKRKWQMSYEDVKEEAANESRQRDEEKANK